MAEAEPWQAPAAPRPAATAKSQTSDAFLAVQLDIEGVDYLEVEHWDPNPGACAPA